jgi:eukaryotic-like serine/threonine-protein kinase
VDSPETLVQASNGPDTAGVPPRGQGARRSPRLSRRAPAEPAGEDGIVLGRYHLLARLGAGGFGVVWRAHDELLGREVAVKRIWLGADGDPDRATREAQATARLSHPAIVALYEACPQGEAFYLISELVHGQTLGALIAADELEDERIVAIGLDLAAALEHAHSRGVIHRDIKPQNVLIPDTPFSRATGERPVAAKLTDFGGASILEEDALTRTGDVLGTLAYMAPEQSEGREVGEEADLYSLALVLYEALCGENPVRGATPAATARRIGSRLDPLGRRRRDLPRELTLALDDALAPDPRHRGTLDDLRAGLEETLEEGLLEAPRRISRGRRRDSRTLLAPRASPGPGPARAPRRPLLEPAQPHEPVALPEHEEVHHRQGRMPAPDHGGLPRTLWIALALAAIVWQAVVGHPGVGMLLGAALLPLAAMPPEPYSRRISPVWLSCLLAPALGVVGLAGVFPAIAGQASGWRKRLVLGALGYWWTVLAEPLLARRLWLGAPAGTPARHVWESSISSTASHVLGPMLSTGVLLGALLWGAGALVLPWLVRGAHAAVDLIAVGVWTAALVLAAPVLDSGLSGAGAHPTPHGAVLGAIAGAMLAVGARALRGPA